MAFPRLSVRGAPRRTRRIVLGVSTLALLLLALLPYLLALPALRNLAVRAALPKFNGTASVGSAALGWFTPLELGQIEIRDAAGASVVSVPRFCGDRPWWRYLVQSADLGQFCLDVPAVNVTVGDQGVNLWQVFATQTAKRIALPDVAVSLRIQKAALAYQGRGAHEPWHVQNINLSLGLQSAGRQSVSGGSGSALVVEPCELFDHVALSAPMCDDLLQYVAPLLANVAQVSGQFSLKLDRWELPGDDPRRGSGKGQLLIHTVDVAPGPLVEHLATILRLPSSVHLVKDSTVSFWLQDGRIYHRDLEFHLHDLVVRMHGSVGFDQTVDLVAEVPWNGRVLALPIAGTLRRPQINFAAMHKANTTALKSTIDRLINKWKGNAAASPAR